MPAPLLDLPLWRIPLDRYHELIESGFFDDDDRLELLEGVLVEMSPKGEGHDDLIMWLNMCLAPALVGRANVRIQSAVTLVGSGSEPEPDVAVTALDVERPYHPGTALLVIEVAVTSLRRDRLAKSRLYAQAGVREYWVVDVRGEAVEVHTAPEGEVYGEVRTARPPEVLVPQATDGPRVPLAELFAMVG